MRRQKAAPRVGKVWIQTACAVVTALLALPLLMTLLSSFMSAEELSVVYAEGESFRWIPYRATAESYFRLLFASETYLATFWNSMGIAAASTALQTGISLIVGYALAKCRFRGRDAVFYVYTLVMLAPYQVTLLPNYMLMKDLGLYNSWWALILPAAFSPLGVFLMRQFLLEMPDEILEAAHMDTSSNLRVLIRVVAPSVRPALLTVAALSFAECWNMVEQPLVLLEDAWRYPLSLRLNGLSGGAMDVRFSGAVLAMLPAILLYFLFENELTEGVRHMKL